MASQYKALVFVILVSAILLWLGKPLFTRFMSEADFNRRRILWLAITTASFLAPNIWIYLLIAAPLMLYGARKDSNPAALYLFLLLAVPPLRVQIPTLGLVGQILPMDHLRLLSLALLLPAALTLRNGAANSRDGAPPAHGAGFSLSDILLLSFLGLQVVLAFPYETVTSTLRRIVQLSIDTALPYFVLSRTCRSRHEIAEAMAAFVMATTLLAPLAVFEFFRGWLLYAGIQNEWSAGAMFYPLHRGDFLRAITTAGHSIYLGYFMAMAFGMWLYLRGRSGSFAWSVTVLGVLLAGLIVTLARGPWIGAAIVLVFYLAAGPKPGVRLTQGLLVVGGVGILVLLSPWRGQIIDHLPFVGTIDSNTIAMRQQLAEGSWLLIQQNPFFGSPYFLKYMEEFRTGEGIIDLVNTYATIALLYGLIGAGLFVFFFSSLIWRAFREARLTSSWDSDHSLLGAALVACLMGTMAIIATTSFLLALPSVAWSLAALTAAYLRLASVAQSTADLSPSPSPSSMPNFHSRIPINHRGHG